MSCRKKRFLIVLAIVTTVLLCGILASALAVDHKTEEAIAMIQPIAKEEIVELKNDNVTEDTLKRLKNNWTVALFGLDSRSKTSLKDGNSDVIMLATVSNKTGEINLVSVYRDTYLKIGNHYGKINSAYPTGGPLGAVKALNENLDLSIDDYVAFNWKAVADAINILGGVDIDVTKKEFKYINAFITETVESTNVPSVHLKKSGMQHLDGVQAVAYARLRLMDDDFKRTERQRAVLMQMLQKAKQADFATLNNIIVTVLPQMASSIDKDDVYTLAANVLKLHVKQTEGFPSIHIAKTVSGVSYVFADDLTKNVSLLHQTLYGETDYVPSKAVEEIAQKSKQKASGGRTYTEKKKQRKQEESPNIIATEAPAEATETETIESETMESEVALEETLPQETGISDMEETEETSSGESGPGVNIPDTTKEIPETQEIGPGIHMEDEAQPETQTETAAETTALVQPETNIVAASEGGM